MKTGGDRDVFRIRSRRASLVVLLFVVGALAAVGDASGAGGSDWPSYLFGPGHSSYNAAATGITSSNAGILKVKWTFPAPTHYTCSPVACPPRFVASPTVEGGHVFIGATDGYFYQLNQTTGGVQHSKNLGYVTPCTREPNRPRGVSATAAIAPDPSRGGAPTVYVAAELPTKDGALTHGGSYLWALDATDLHAVWATDPVLIDAQPGSYAYSSPAVMNGHVYVGITSDCDHPLVRGGVAGFNQSDGSKIAPNYWTVPAIDSAGHANLGGGVWTSVAVDSATGSVFATTGNGNEGQTGALFRDSYSVVRLDGSTLTRVDRWTLSGDTTSDHDFGASPSLFTNSTGAKLVSACNKNGVLYVWNRENLAAGPVWTFTVGQKSGEWPFDACLSATAFDRSTGALIIGGNHTAPGTTIDGTQATGSVRALSSAPAPVAHRVLWDNRLACNVIGTPSINGNGIIAVPEYYTHCDLGASPAVVLFDGRHPTASATGRPNARWLARISAPGGVFAQPTFAGNFLFVATLNGQLTAYGP